MKSRLQGFFEGLNISANEPTFGGYIVPDLGSFEIKNALVRRKLNNGQEWNHPDKPMPILPTVYPHYSFEHGVPIPKHEDMLEQLRGQDAIGLNLKPAPLPFYPEVERVKALASGNQEKAEALREQHHPPAEPLGFVEEAAASMQLKSKYSPQMFDRLIQLGFSEEMIAKTVTEEIQKDIQKVLENPTAYTRELDTASALENMYESWKTRRAQVNTGLQGATLGSDVQNPNVFGAAGTARENLPMIAKTGAQRMMQEMREPTPSAAAQDMMRLALENPIPSRVKAQVEGMIAHSPEQLAAKAKRAEFARSNRMGEKIADQIAAEDIGLTLKEYKEYKEMHKKGKKGK